ncbi:MAG: hypothetical protein ABI338_03765 [Gemmatimonadaceae bacterium]
MPLVVFSSLPDDARVWIFGSSRALDRANQDLLLNAVDDYLSGWRAHGSPLTVGREWRDDRFLAIAVDQRDTNASGCSLDALFRVLRDVESRVGLSLLSSSLVYFRLPDETVSVTDRAGFACLAQDGSIGPDTHVFDLSAQTVGEWRKSFEVRASDAWHRALLPVAV